MKLIENEMIEIEMREMMNGCSHGWTSANWKEIKRERD